MMSDKVDRVLHQYEVCLKGKIVNINAHYYQLGPGGSLEFSKHDDKSGLCTTLVVYGTGEWRSFAEIFDKIEELDA